MNKIETYIRLRGGRLTMEEKGRFFDKLRSFPDGLYTLVASLVYDKRSNPQNRYYWGVVVKAYKEGALKEWGEVLSAQESHEALKSLFNFDERINEDTGESIKVPRTTTRLNTSEFSAYTEHCRNHIQEWFGIETPDPE